MSTISRFSRVAEWDNSVSNRLLLSVAIVTGSSIPSDDRSFAIAIARSNVAENASDSAANTDEHTRVTCA
jgi:hypothetical protein